MAYNGWKNYETWNVALWIGNDEGLYLAAKEFKGFSEPYSNFLMYLEAVGRDLRTPDGVSYKDDTLDIPALDEMIREL